MSFLTSKFWKKKQNIEDLGPRIIFTDSHEQNAQFRYPNNYVRTSKYTFLTFLPKNLLEQFMRVANLYFLVISGLQQIPNVSPTGRWTTLGPLAVVLTCTAIKEAFEDIKRHRQDNEINNRKIEVLRGNSFVRILWKEVLVGDIIKVFPSPYVVILNTSEPQGLCYIETANLDGETNLKSRQALPETLHLLPENLHQLKGAEIKCEQPNNRLYNFDGSLDLNGKVYPLSVNQILLRGAMLRNTKWVYGIVVFTGHDTKLMKNANPSPVKRTNVERLVNFQIIAMFSLLIIMAIISVIGFSLWQKAVDGGAWYLDFDDNAAANTALSFITFIILYNNLIPISLYVSVEIVKFVQAYFINNDLEMYHEESDTPALARTSNLNEELGQVNIYCDKTGTLTCNRMEFLKCSIGGISYGSGETEIDRVNRARREGRDLAELESPSVPKTKKSQFAFQDDNFLKNLQSHSSSEYIRDACMLLAVCHTVIPEEDKDHVITYQASSPDEAALVLAAKHFGYEFYSRNPKSVIVRAEGKELEYQILNVLEFTNVRKRMSVIVRTPEGKLVLYCKGADTVILERLAPDQLFKEQTLVHLEEFAGQGLRTLCLSRVHLDEKEYAEWSNIWQEASTTVINRDEAVAKAAELIEKNLFLLGATAVEDKLQDGVPDTIATLAKAGIKIWVLTGDKQETAINIGFACRLLTKEMTLLVVNQATKADTRLKIDQYLAEYESVSDESENLALIIDGGTLLHALEEDIKMDLLSLAKKCKAVICCRVSPLQKALVVRLVRNNLNTITLAIGDGANDVSMIQEAHVGVGISGEEGLQAARASDYAIAQFRFVNGFSGQTLYERWTLAAYNVAFTFFPVLLFGIQDKDIQDETILANPQLYIAGQKKYHFNIRVFWGWIVNAIFHSFIIFVIPTVAFEHNLLNSNGQVSDLWSMGTVIYTCVILVVNLKLAVETTNWTLPFQVALWASILAWVAWLLVYSVLGLIPFLIIGSDALFVTYNIYNTALPYFVVFIVVVLSLSRDIIWKFFKRTYFPQAYHIFQDQEYIMKERRKQSIDEEEMVTLPVANQIEM